MGDIKIGDNVCTASGNLAKVINLYPQGKKDIYKITFSNGDYVECCEDHLWKVNDEYHKKFDIIVNTKTIINKFVKKGRRIFSINIPNPTFFLKQKITIDPYLLGVLLGDGCITQNTINICSDDIEIIEYISDNLIEGYSINKKKNKFHYSIKRIKHQNRENYYKTMLSEYGLMGKNCYNKYIPNEYKYNSIDIKLKLIQGLMDTDGSASSRDGYAIFSTSSERLSIDFKELIESIGGICTIKEKIPSYYYKGIKRHGKIHYVCYIRRNDPSILFSLKRKKEKRIKRTKYFVKRMISNVQYIGKKEAQCILIDDKDHLYLTNNFIPTHNTHLAISYAVFEFLHGNYKKIIMTRPIVEAGEKLGFLPGELENKIHPYMVPILDLLEDKLDTKTIEECFDSGKFETAPIAYMRGRTLKGIIILDEIQNCSISQIKMVLTRLGENSKIICTGDLDQSDLSSKNNNLKLMIEKLSKIDGIDFFNLKKSVRHPLIGKIIEAFDEI